MMRKIWLLLALCLLWVGVASAQTNTIADVVGDAAATDGEFTILLAALQAADPVFLDVLADADAAVTVFAPTDAAFEELLAALNATPQGLLSNRLLVNDLLSYHVVPGVFSAQSLIEMGNGARVGTLLRGETLRVSQEGDAVFVNASEVIESDLFASNGIVHVIDTVLATEPETDFQPTGTLADVVVANAEDASPEFTVLLSAAQAADPLILERLTDGLPYTLLAPTDAAFAEALDELGVSQGELLADTDRLTAILEYHLIPGRLSFDELFEVYLRSTGTPRVASLVPGVTLDVLVENNGIALNYANIILPDVMATNGVLHVIDAVLIPPQ